MVPNGMRSVWVEPGCQVGAASVKPSSCEVLLTGSCLQIVLVYVVSLCIVISYDSVV